MQKYAIASKVLNSSVRYLYKFFELHLLKRYKFILNKNGENE